MQSGLRGLMLVVMLFTLGAIAWAQGGADTAGGDPAAGVPPAPRPAMSFNTVTSPLYGFSIALPTTGTILTPDSPNWPWADLDKSTVIKADTDTGFAKAGSPKPPARAVTPPAAPTAGAEAGATPPPPADRVLNSGVAFHWYGTGVVKEILVACSTFETPVMESTFREFTKALQQDFIAEDQAKEEAKAKDKTSAVKKAVGIDKDVKRFVVTPAAIPPTTDGSRWSGFNIKDQRDPKNPVNYSILSTYGSNKVYTVTLFYLTPLDEAIKNTGGMVMNSLRSPEMTGPFGIEPSVLDLAEDGTLAQPGMRPQPMGQPAARPNGSV